MSVYVDPVAQGREYQELLLRVLGDRDPADIQQSTPGELRRLAAAAGDRLRVRPEPREWSVFECIAHICDAELVISGRFRWILAHDEPPLPGYDQDLWVDRLHQSAEETIDELFAWFEPLRAANLALWRRTPAGLRARYGIHSERGPESYELTMQLYAGHDVFHLEQTRKTLEQVLGAGSA